jgi:cellulose synthase/poly-beta-1,6-N-acetylglucosamine synthase-like glycosyltransferase
MHYLENLYDSCNLEIIRNEKINFFPFQIPIVTFTLNKIFRLPIFNFFCINNITILKKKTIKRETNYNVSVIIPCKNEEENIEEIGKQLINLGKRTQYLFGDDLSTDNTKSEIIKIMNKNDNNNINIVHYEGPGICKSENVYKGIDNAEGDIILIYDADNTVSLVDIYFCINLLIKGNSDIINCTRMIYPQHKEAMKRINFFGNIIFAYLFSVLFKKKITDTLCGTKIFYKKDWGKIKKDISLWGAKDLWGDFDILIGAYKNNLKITEVPVIYRERIAGKTKMTSVFKNGLRMLWIVFYSFYKIRIKY